MSAASCCLPHKLLACRQPGNKETLHTSKQWRRFCGWFCESSSNCRAFEEQCAPPRSTQAASGPACRGWIANASGSWLGTARPGTGSQGRRSPVGSRRQGCTAGDTRSAALQRAWLCRRNLHTAGTRSSQSCPCPSKRLQSLLVDSRAPASNSWSGDGSPPRPLQASTSDRCALPHHHQPVQRARCTIRSRPYIPVDPNPL